MVYFLASTQEHYMKVVFVKKNDSKWAKLVLKSNKVEELPRTPAESWDLEVCKREMFIPNYYEVGERRRELRIGSK